MKNKVGVNNAIKDFFNRLTSANLLLHDDYYWPNVINIILPNKDEEFQIQFWEELDKKIKEKEKDIGHCHKGLIYWRLAILFLGKSDLSSAINYLEQAVAEDEKRGDTFSAAIGLQSVIDPLLNRYKDNTQSWKFDEDIMNFYQLLPIDEKKKFASNIGLIHDRIVGFQLSLIKEDFFDFISTEQIRSIVKDIYFEVANIIIKKPIITFYSPIFAVGSILEGMLDDLFQRNNKKVWHLFKTTPNAREFVKKGTLMDSSDYKTRMSLGEKIKILEFMARCKCCPISEYSILMMLIIEEYRNLIHLRRVLEFKFKTNVYIAGFLFQFIGSIASEWWPENVNSKIRLINENN